MAFNFLFYNFLRTCEDTQLRRWNVGQLNFKDTIQRVPVVCKGLLIGFTHNFPFQGLKFISHVAFKRFAKPLTLKNSLSIADKLKSINLNRGTLPSLSREPQTLIASISSISLIEPSSPHVLFRYKTLIAYFALQIHRLAVFSFDKFL